MPKHYCDYCDVYLTHDSTSVRKAHNSGRNHLSNVRDYYASLGNDQAQNIIDQITAAYMDGVGYVPPQGGYRPPQGGLAPPLGGYAPPGGFGPPHRTMPPPPFGMPGLPMPPFPPSYVNGAGLPGQPPFHPGGPGLPPPGSSGLLPSNSSGLPGDPPGGYGPNSNGENDGHGGIHPDRKKMIGGQ